MEIMWRLTADFCHSAVDLHLAQFMISERERKRALNRLLCSGKDFSFAWYGACSLINFGNNHMCALVFILPKYERAVSCQLEVIEGALESKSRYTALILSPTVRDYQ
jgi:hypothetical protein